MMVLASIYLYVSGSLPTTSSIKPVEVWLIFNLVYPCLIILSNVLYQVILGIPFLFSLKIIFLKVLDTPGGSAERKITPASSKVFLPDKKSQKSKRIKYIKRFSYFYNPVLYVTFAILYFAFYFITLSQTGHTDTQTMDHE